jgi:hypothetical protein
MEKIIPILQKIVKYGGTVALIVAACKFVLDGLNVGTPTLPEPIKVADATDSK